MVGSALREVFRLRGYRHLALGLFVLGLAFYLVMLPATYTGGAVGWVSLRYLNVELSLTALILALLLSVVLTLNVYSARIALRQQGTGLSVGAVLASLVPSSICCTPLLPSVLAAIGASTPQIFSLTGRIQGTVARYEALFLVLSILLLLVALRLAAQGVCWSCRLAERRSVSDASRGESIR
jgi:hypothetical protein